jgi:hypothetical protein
LPHNIEEENGIMKNADTGKSKGIWPWSSVLLILHKIKQKSKAP